MRLALSILMFDLLEQVVVDSLPSWDSMRIEDIAVGNDDQDFATLERSKIQKKAWLTMST